MKKTLMIIMIILLSLCAYSCNEDEDEDLYSKYPELFESSLESNAPKIEIGEGKIIINNVETDIKATIYENTADIPLLAVLEALGADITWNDDSQANMAYNGKTYKVELLNQSLKEEYGPENLLQNNGNPNYNCEVKYRELIIDQVTLCTLMIKLDTRINYEMSYDSMTIAISLK